MRRSARGSSGRGGRACPTCGAPTEHDQLVCLTCGSRVGLYYRRPPGWRVPVAIIAAVVLLVAAASVIALGKIRGGAEREAGRNTIDVKGGAGGKAAADRRAREAAGTSGGLVRQGSLYGWPRELGGFTVVLLRTEDRAEADDFARSAAEDRPAKIGVIRTDDFRNLEDGFHLVFAGRYANREEADRAAERLGARFPGAFAQRVER